MSAGIVSATIRVTVLGDAGRADLAVPLDRRRHPRRQLRRVRRRRRCPRPRHHAGVLLDGAPLRRRGRPAPRRRGGRPRPRRPRDAAAGRRRGGVAARAPVRTAPAAAAPRCSPAWRRRGRPAGPAATGAAGPARSVLGLLLLCALVSAVPLGPARASPPRARSAASPAFGAGAGFVAAYSDAPGGLLLGLAVAALAAAVFAAVARTFLDPDQDGWWRSGWWWPRWSRC